MHSSEDLKSELNGTTSSLLNQITSSNISEESFISELSMRNCSGLDLESGENSRNGSGTECGTSFENIPGISSYVKCQICDEVAAPDQDGLTAHLMSHVNESNRCQVCSDQGEFDNAKQLFYHMSSHTTRVFECQFCGKPGRLHYLKIHIRSHTGEKPYRCRTCNRGFADASTFRRHQRVHTGEKPYQCPICGRQIARKDNVKVHMRSHMKHQYPRCRKCGMLFLRRSEVEAHEKEGACT